VIVEPTKKWKHGVLLKVGIFYANLVFDLFAIIRCPPGPLPDPRHRKTLTMYLKRAIIRVIIFGSIALSSGVWDKELN